MDANREKRFLNQIVQYLETTVNTQKKQRTKSEVLEQRKTMQGCCNRYADYMACDCLETALPDPVPVDAVHIGPYYSSAIASFPADNLSADNELKTMADVWSMLKAYSYSARRRILDWLSSRDI